MLRTHSPRSGGKWSKRIWKRWGQVPGSRAIGCPPLSGQTPRRLYPGHLVIARAEALRFPLINRLLELAYRYRNRVLEKRYLGITMGAVGTLLRQDIRNVFQWQLPVLTWGVPWRGLRGYYRYRRGRATLGDVEDFLTHAFLHRRFHSLAGGRPLAISTTSLVAFAKDIDTKAELEELQPP